MSKIIKRLTEHWGLNMSRIVMTREQWILATQMSSSIMAMNAPFCDSGPAEGPNTEWLEPIAHYIAESTSEIALEDVIPILERALEIATMNQNEKREGRQ